MISRVFKILRIFFNLYFFPKLFVTNFTQIRIFSHVYFSRISHITNMSQSYVTMVPLLIFSSILIIQIFIRKLKGITCHNKCDMPFHQCVFSCVLQDNNAVVWCTIMIDLQTNLYFIATVAMIATLCILWNVFLNYHKV